MTYDQWKTRDPNEPFADHEEEQMPMPTEPSALLPCPFCCGPADWVAVRNGGYRVQCQHCLAQSGWGDYGYQVEAKWNTRAVPAQGDPVAWRWRKIGCDWWIYRDQDDFPDDDTGELQPLYAALPSSPAPTLRSLNSGENEPSVMPARGAGEAISPADIAEVLENVREGIAIIQLQRGTVPIELHRACQALAHMARPR